MCNLIIICWVAVEQCLQLVMSEAGAEQDVFTRGGRGDIFGGALTNKEKQINAECYTFLDE